MDLDRAEDVEAPLRGARIGILEGRMTQQLVDLVRRHGGVPVAGPALQEAPLDAAKEVGALTDALAAGLIAFVIFLTGVGAAALFREAAGLGRLDELVSHLQTTTNVSRGQKPYKPLKERGVPISVTVPSPYTTDDVLNTLEQLPLEGAGVALLHYGERSDMLTEALARRGATAFELLLYEWRLPEDTGPLKALVREIVDDQIDAVVFTTQVQVRHLLQVAEEEQLKGALLEALNGRTIVAAVGPTCAAALEAAGVRVQVVPINPKMGPMLMALADHLREPGGSSREPDSFRG